jgi:hypothetical protein
MSEWVIVIDIIYWNNLLCCTGDVYEGSYENDKRNGQGTYTYASGAIYKGNYKDSKCDGHGVHQFVNGDVYEGM